MGISNDKIKDAIRVVFTVSSNAVTLENDRYEELFPGDVTAEDLISHVKRLRILPNDEFLRVLCYSEKVLSVLDSDDELIDKRNPFRVEIVPMSQQNVNRIDLLMVRWKGTSLREFLIDVDVDDEFREIRMKIEETIKRVQGFRIAEGLRNARFMFVRPGRESMELWDSTMLPLNGLSSAYINIVEKIGGIREQRIGNVGIKFHN
jgi:hypothetical protein